MRITDWASLERKLRQDEAMEEFEAAAEEMEAAKAEYRGALRALELAAYWGAYFTERRN